MNNHTNYFRLYTTLLFGIALFFSSPSKQLAQTQKQVPKQEIKSQELSAKEIAKTILPGVLLIECDNGKGDSSLGSGFFIRPGVVVTNYHVVENMIRGTVELSSNEKQIWRIDSILEYDEKADLAILSVPTSTDAKVTTLKTINSLSEISVGETIFALGNPRGLTGTISQGIISASPRQLEDGTLLQITAPISAGSSGGPVVNSKGQVVGVAVGALRGGQNLNFAVPAPSINSLFQKTEGTAKPNLFSVSQVERAWKVPLRLLANKNTRPRATGVIGPLRKSEDSDVASMRGIKAIEVLVEDLPDELRGVITREQIQTLVELRVRRNGIRVVSNSISEPGSPYLYVRISALAFKSLRGEILGYNGSIEISLYQRVRLMRDEDFVIFAKTWQKGGIFYFGRDIVDSSLTQSIGEYADRFCNAFLAAQ